MSIAQLVMILVLILMASGKTPLYLTAILGSTLAALLAGIPVTGAPPVTVSKLVTGGLHGVIADITGVLLFIGIMQAAGMLDVIVRHLIILGDRLGRGPGVAMAGGIAAGIIGGLTGFTQPAITGAITGPAALKLGSDPNRVAGIQAHAGHLGNFGGFTHPAQVAIVATAAIGFGVINVLGSIVALSVFVVSFFRMRKAEKDVTASVGIQEVVAAIGRQDLGLATALFPFLLLVVGFVMGYPVFLVGITSGVLAGLLARQGTRRTETLMLEGVQRVATPLVATIGFLYMSAVIRNIGLVALLSRWLEPVIAGAPIQAMLLIAALTGFMTQSYAASAAIVVPVLQVVLGLGANPLSAAFAAAAGASLMQYYLTGGPVAALATVIPIVPGSDLTLANRFQRPSILAGLALAFLLSFVV